jgi:hypothetical protein
VRLRIQSLVEEHDRAASACGHPNIDDFLKTIARQRQERRIAATLVAVDADGDSRRIVGYYTLLTHALTRIASLAEEGDALRSSPIRLTTALARSTRDSTLSLSKTARLV